VQHQPFFSGAVYVAGLLDRDEGGADLGARRLKRDAAKYRIDLMVHRIATSELYRDSPTRVRCQWAFVDFVAAHVLLDVSDEERARAEAAHGGR
jgi:hypothetical protein